MCYRIAWRSRLTGATGQGEFLDKRIAEAFLSEARREWGHIVDHWLEPEKP